MTRLTSRASFGGSLARWCRQRRVSYLMASGIALMVAVVGLAALLIRWAPHWLASSDGSPADRAAEITAVRTALLVFTAGIVTMIGLIYTARSFGLARQGQITDRFTRSVDQIGSDQPEIRLGGIYALERIAHESARDCATVVEILCALVRARAPQVLADPLGSGPAAPAPIATDVQAALTVIARRPVPQDSPASKSALDLSHTDLRGVVLRHGQLDGANLAGAWLNDADLAGSHLLGTNLVKAQLPRANLCGVELDYADLTGANLEGANLGGANLHHATLRFARLRSALLRDANLTDANLFSADLEKADLWGADVQRARLWNGHLPGADLSDALLVGSLFNSGTEWPDAYDPIAAGAVRDTGHQSDD